MVALQVLRASGCTGLFKLTAEPGAAAVATAVLLLSGRRVEVYIVRHGGLHSFARQLGGHFAFIHARRRFTRPWILTRATARSSRPSAPRCPAAPLGAGDVAHGAVPRRSWAVQARSLELAAKGRLVNGGKAADADNSALCTTSKCHSSISIKRRTNHRQTAQVYTPAAQPPRPRDGVRSALRRDATSPARRIAEGA